MHAFVGVLCLAALGFAQEKCPPSQYNELQINYLNEINKHEVKVHADIKAQGFAYLTKLNDEVIQKAFTEHGCPEYSHGKFTEADREQYLWEFMATFKTKSNITFDAELVALAKALETFMFFAAKNKPFITCMGNKIRDNVLTEVDKCMGEKYKFDVKKLDDMAIADVLGDEEYEKNIHAYLSMHIKAIFNASKCSDPQEVVKALNTRKIKGFCQAAQVFPGKSKDCHDVFKIQCPLGVNCFRELIGQFEEKLKPILFNVMKGLKDCNVPSPEGAPTVKEIIISGIKMWKESEAILEKIKTDPKYAKLREEGRDYLRILLESYINEAACDCPAA